MRRDEIFLLGAMTGAVVVWVWGARLVNRVAPRRGRTTGADDGQAVEAAGRAAMRPAVDPGRQPAASY